MENNTLSGPDGQPALVATLPEPQGVSAHSCDGQAQGMQPSVIVLVRKDDLLGKPVLYACGKCGAVHSPRIYACRDDLAHETARKAAEECYTCREHNVCSACEKPCPKGWTMCDPCRFDKKLAAAQEVPDDGGPYCAFDGDTYFHEMEEAQDAGLEWVSPCKVAYPKLSIDGILDPLFDDMHEDASVDALNGVPALEAAVAAFNEAQTTRSFWGDDKRKIRVPAQVGTRPKGEDANAASFTSDAAAKPCAQGEAA